jgi:hypothetical protein
MVETLIKFLIKLLPRNKKHAFVQLVFNNNYKTYKEMLTLLENEYSMYKATFSIYIDQEAKEKELISFFSSASSEEPRQIYSFMDKFNEEYFIEIALKEAIVLYSLKVNLALLNYPEYTSFMAHFEEKKESLIDYINSIISLKLQSLNKEIIIKSWEEAIIDKRLIPDNEEDDDLWN